MRHLERSRKPLSSASERECSRPFGFYPKGLAVRRSLQPSRKLLPGFACGLPTSPDPSVVSQRGAWPDRVCSRQIFKSSRTLWTGLFFQKRLQLSTEVNERLRIRSL